MQLTDESGSSSQVGSHVALCGQEGSSDAWQLPPPHWCLITYRHRTQVPTCTDTRSALDRNNALSLSTPSGSLLHEMVRGRLLFRTAKQAAASDQKSFYKNSVTLRPTWISSVNYITKRRLACKSPRLGSFVGRGFTALNSADSTWCIVKYPSETPPMSTPAGRWGTGGRLRMPLVNGCIQL
ncbi:hypothetical protein H257_00969 [Aphanomyces astaci]|uniref:Uncharacterized protein n=1 Tax=Aphanomyces astaci TaxID=112090 RepID=W4H5S4_APHAT|nr:hypothetical protein H257_00969 [Aphanomyces astaci]ETV87370.1 hypothetical protein H257_00969 [Aphanomyces astaci]|eukprot:XP_009822233.1 hypothetical protein H257_00969 [Aphanomyces astaci]